MTSLRLLVALPLAALAACVPAPEPAPAPLPEPPPAPVPTPTPTPAPPAPPPFAGNWMDAPITAGDWQYVPNPTGGTARFGDAASGTLLEFRCNRRTGVVEIVRAGGAGTVQGLVVRTETMAQSVSVAPGAGLTVFGQLIASDPLLDAIAFSKGRFAVEAPGLPTLYVPSYPEITRVIEDCR